MASRLTWRGRWSFAAEGVSLVGSGLAMALAVEPVGWWPLAWVAIAPLAWAVTRPGLGWRRAALLGLAWGLGYDGLTLWWLTGIHPMTWLGVPWLQSFWITAACWLAVTLWGAAVPIVWSIGLQLFSSQRSGWVGAIGRVILAAALWAGLESLANQTPLWWPALALTQVPGNLAIAHLGQLSGPGLVAAAIVASNGLWAEAVRAGFSPKLSQPNGFIPISLTGLAIVGISHAIGLGLWSQPLLNQPGQALAIGLIQGNIPNEIKFGSEGWRRSLAGYTQGYELLARRGADAVLLPETALPIVWTPDQRGDSPFYQALRLQEVPAIVGAFAPDRDRPDRLNNTLIATDRDGETIGHYNKTKLVPLGEYIPFEELLGQLIGRLSPLDAVLAAGSPEQHLDTSFGRVIAAICYDSAFSELLRRQAASGGELILTAANNAHYRVAMFAQHHAQDILRAIELDRWVVRATNTGFSAVITPHGETRWRSRPNVYAIHLAHVQRRTTITPYVRWGDWFTPSLGLVAVALKLAEIRYGHIGPR